MKEIFNNKDFFKKSKTKGIELIGKKGYNIYILIDAYYFL